MSSKKMKKVKKNFKSFIKLLKAEIQVWLAYKFSKSKSWL
jgi:hypothetical protein